MVDRTKLVGELMLASEEVVQRVKEVIEGKERRSSDDVLAGRHLLTIKEAQKNLGWKYGKVYRAMGEGLLDTVTVMGQRHVTEQSLIELSEGKRLPSAEAVRKRDERNVARREAYRRERARAQR